MAAPTFAHAIELLNAERARSEFSCGKESLDRYLMQQASQDLRCRSLCPIGLGQ